MTDLIYITYLATFLSILGNIFIVKKSRIGYWIWIASNIFWIYVDYKIPEMSAQIIMMVFYIILNVWGLYEWRGKEKEIENN